MRQHTHTQPPVNTGLIKCFNKACLYTLWQSLSEEKILTAQDANLSNSSFLSSPNAFISTGLSIPQSVSYIICPVCCSWMLFLGIFHLQAFCCLFISPKMERISQAKLFPGEQLPAGHGNQKYAPTVFDSGIYAATALHRLRELALAKLPLLDHCRSYGKRLILVIMSSLEKNKLHCSWFFECNRKKLLIFHFRLKTCASPVVYETKDGHRAHGGLDCQYVPSASTGTTHSHHQLVKYSVARNFRRHISSIGVTKDQI